MIDYNEDVTGTTLTLNRLLALGVVAVVMWVGILKVGVMVWEYIA